MSSSPVRLRFAPSPTGFMHLANGRIALLNYLFARHTGGSLILRIEDTDAERNFDPGARQILKDLAWLGITFDEGPHLGGPYGPYAQSERTDIYQKHLECLIEKKQVYRCFCSEEDLENKRARQIVLKLPPRYDRTCASLSDEQISKKLDANMPFIWRLKLNYDLPVIIHDLARGDISFDLQNFSDFAITRQDGSVTFLFANAVDDITMRISHVVRGEDHLSNTACQAAIYHALGHKLPLYWHIQIMINKEGKKLSKRDFGFSLKDLQQGGYLPEAICNYLALINGGSFTQEIMSLDELSLALNFENLHAASHAHYDLEKLTWINHKWIERLTTADLVTRCLPYLTEAYPQVNTLDHQTISQLVQAVKTDLPTLQSITQALAFYFSAPLPSAETITTLFGRDILKKLQPIVMESIENAATAEQFLTRAKSEIRKHEIKPANFYHLVRTALSGSPEGLNIQTLITILGIAESKKRIIALFALVNGSAV